MNNIDTTLFKKDIINNFIVPNLGEKPRTCSASF